MLQLNQLQQLAARRPNEIVELQNFFRNASLPLHTADSLPTLASRVQQERSFRRDLISHLWIISHNDTPPVALPELLGLLTIAAAGPERAANATDSEAHSLLRFLMEARRTFDGIAMTPQVVPIRSVADVPPIAVSEAPLPHIAPVLVSRRTPLASESSISHDMDEETTDRRPLIGLVLAACLVIALSLVLWLRHASTPQEATNTILASQPAATIGSPAQPTVTPASSAAAEAHSAPMTHRSADSSISRRNNSPSLKPSPFVTNRVPSAPAAPPPSPRIASHSVPAPTETLPTVASGRRTLNRRAPAVPAAAATSSEPRVANVQPVELGTDAEPTGSNASSSHPVVRPLSLGIMAANVTYSPAPTYPPAASAAHVQGEVKVEAEVGTDGNVTSARVISGPPLLREAAVSAVERWRYRPYMAEGRPITMSALIVMDFQLP